MPTLPARILLSWCCSHFLGSRTVVPKLLQFLQLFMASVKRLGLLAVSANLLVKSILKTIQISSIRLLSSLLLETASYICRLHSEYEARMVINFLLNLNSQASLQVRLESRNSWNSSGSDNQRLCAKALLEVVRVT